MTHFLRHLPWEDVAIVIVIILVAFVAFRVGRRWRGGWKEAIRNKREYHMLKSDAQLRSAQTQGVHVEVSPTITAGIGVQSTVRHTRSEQLDDHRPLAPCAWCGRFGCRNDCREARLNESPQLLRGLDPDELFHSALDRSLDRREHRVLDMGMVRRRHDTQLPTSGIDDSNTFGDGDEYIGV